MVAVFRIPLNVGQTTTASERETVTSMMFVKEIVLIAKLGADLSGTIASYVASSDYASVIYANQTPRGDPTVDGATRTQLSYARPLGQRFDMNDNPYVRDVDGPS